MSEQENGESIHPLFVVGGIALMALGAGLAMKDRRVRQAVLGALRPWLAGLEGPLHAGAGKLFSDVERYWKLREM